MIDYQTLCQAIAEWKSGQRPSSGPHRPSTIPEPVEELGSGMVEMDDSDVTYEDAPAEDGEHGDPTHRDAQPYEDPSAGEDVILEDDDLRG